MSTAKREKYWGELSQEQKIERLASNLYNVICRGGAISDEVRQLCKHKHLPDGEIAIPLKNLATTGSSGHNYNFDMLQRKEELK